MVRKLPPVPAGRVSAGLALLLAAGGLALASTGCTVAGSALGHAIDQAALQRPITALDCSTRSANKGKQVTLHLKSGKTISGRIARVECAPETTLYLQAIGSPEVMPGAYPAPEGPQAFPLRDVETVTRTAFGFAGVGLILGMTADAIAIWLILSWRGLGAPLD